MAKAPVKKPADKKPAGKAAPVAKGAKMPMGNGFAVAKPASKKC